MTVINPSRSGGGGSGLPGGGSAGQILEKASSSDGDAGWQNSAPLSNTLPIANGVASAGTSAEASRADHTHPSAAGMKLPSGLWVPVTQAENASIALVLNREYCVGFLLGPQTIDKISLATVTPNADGSPAIRFGIRADNDGKPGAVVHQQSVAATAAGFVTTASIGYTHPGGIFWFSWMGQGWSSTALSVSTAALTGGIQIIPAAHQATLDYALGVPNVVGGQDGTSGALPTSFSAIYLNLRLPLMFMRRA